MEKMYFTFSDMIAGYVVSVTVDEKKFVLKTTDERSFEVQLTDATFGFIIQNLNEPYQELPVPLEQMIVPGKYLFTQGIFYPEKGDFNFDAKSIIFVGEQQDKYRFEEPDWWIHQISALAHFYFNAQFPDGIIDYRNYRTYLTLEGKKIDGTRQETDTISRMIYGFATTYLLTGEDRYLEAAEKGTEYLRANMRVVEENENIAYWYHAIDRQDNQVRKIFASQFDDDYDAIPAYEQIYALTGPVQTYRVTSDPLILKDAEMTINLFDKFFMDREHGGYFSHIAPQTFDPRDVSLGKDSARKNWNSTGDHAPAYLINLWLATGEKKYADFLLNTADIIEEHFPDYDQSPFVQERFYEDWRHDTTWVWQQNRAVIGHNLKIAWNLMRIHHLHPNKRYVNLAKKIATIMPDVGMDKQRGGWYDVIERVLEKDKEWLRLVWHDRKAWWQQEQAILAYLILHGSLKKPDHLRLARESMAFYNAFFPDHDNGGIYFNVMASGIPYLIGKERLKGNHSMSGYHSFELCYLAAVYTNLLISHKPMDFYFKPKAGGLKDGILRVQPDILPPGSVQLEKVWINGDSYDNFDPAAMTIKLPQTQDQSLPQEYLTWNVRVRIIPTGLSFDATVDIVDETAYFTLYGELQGDATIVFQEQLDKIIAAQPKSVVFYIGDLCSISPEAARALSFALGKLTINENLYIGGANETVKSLLQSMQIWQEFRGIEEYNATGRTY